MFQRFVNNAIRRIGPPDDIIFFFFKEHKRHVRAVLADLKLYPLSRIHRAGRRTQNEPQVTSDWQVPTCVRDLRAFVGLANPYRISVSHFSGLAAPSWPREWSGGRPSAVDELEEALQSDMVLVGFDYWKDSVLECDASKYAYVDILSQYT